MADTRRGSTSDDRTVDPLGDPDRPFPDELSKVISAIDSCEAFHTSWETKIEARYRAYRGIAEQRTQVQTQDWRSKLTTPYLLQVVEGMIATMLDPQPKWDVKAKPLAGEPLEEIHARQSSSAVASSALQWAMDEDKFHYKQRPFMQQDLIVGATLAKTVWAYETKDSTILVPVTMEVTDDWGLRKQYKSVEEQSRMRIIRDGPSMIVRDMRDFFWPEGAKDIPSAPWVIDRSWETWETLKSKERAGLYKNVDLLKNARNDQAGNDLSGREQMLWSQERNKDLIEILEYWENGHCITVGGRAVVLSSKEDPLRLKSKPFVMCSAMPDAFQMVGVSVIESLAQIQEYLWTIQNQRIDALRLLTNVITTIRSDVDDPDAFEWYPGAQWMVEDPGQVGQLQIDPTAASITLEAEALLKGDLQNMMGGLPMAGGVNSGSIDQTTATGMSIITSIAQKLIQSRKQHYSWAYSQVGEMFLGMMGQMLREERHIPQIGRGGEEQLLTIRPLDLQGEFDVNVNVMDESALKQEKVSEAMAMLNVVVPIAQIANINLQPFVEGVLKANGVQNTEQYFNKPQPPPPNVMGQPPGGGGANGAGTPQGIQGIQDALKPPGSGGQTNAVLAAQMGGNNGLTASPEQFAKQQITAAQQLGG